MKALNKKSLFLPLLIACAPAAAKDAGKPSELKAAAVWGGGEGAPPRPQSLRQSLAKLQAFPEAPADGGFYQAEGLLAQAPPGQPAKKRLFFGSGSRGLQALAAPKREPAAAAREKKLKGMKAQSFSDLKDLTPFESVSVIQKRYLPKTKRGEISLSAASLLNNHYFYQLGGRGQMGFFFQEKHGIGLEGLAALRLKKIVTREMEKNLDLFPTNPIWTRFYGGAYYKFSPVFGKFAVLNRKIIYFDIFFKLGGGAAWGAGLTEEELRRVPAYKEGGAINEGGQDKQMTQDIWPAASFGMGQTFALSKSWGFVWEFQGILYQYKYRFFSAPDRGKSSIQYDLMFSLGLNYYFPGVSDR